MNFGDITRQPKRLLTSPCWSGMMNDGRAYSAWCMNVERLVPWRTLTAADRAASRASDGSSLGALLMGATFTLTSVTCTAPFVGTLLVLAARGSWSTPLLGMLVYSSAFAFPFVLLALAPRLVSRLPRSGDWIRALRVLIGLLEVGAAVKFISNADLVLGWGFFTRSLVLLLWAMLALVGVGYLSGGIVQRLRRHELPIGRILSAAVALTVALWLGSGLRGQQLPQIEAFLPPPSDLRVFGSSDAPQWMLNDYDAAIGAARKSGRLVFLDFTGYTCTNCRWMEANIFTRPDVGGELGRFVLARLYTDGEGEIYERQQAFQEKTFGTVALPLYAVVDASGKVRGTFSGLTRDPAEFIAFLRRSSTGT